MRQDIANICNKLATNQGINFYIMDAYNAIYNYCKEHKTQPSKNTYKIIDGALYVNNDFTIRVLPLKKPVFDEHSYYIEGLILARQDEI